MPIASSPAALRALTLRSSPTLFPARNRNVRPPAAPLTRPRRGTGRAAGPRGAARGRCPAGARAATRSPCAVSAAVAPAPSISVTISSAVGQQLGEKAARCLRKRLGHRLDPAAGQTDPVAGLDRAADGESLARTARVTSPARTRVAAACMAPAFSSPVGSRVVLEQGGESLLDAGCVDHEDGLSRELARPVWRPRGCSCCWGG